MSNFLSWKENNSEECVEDVLKIGRTFGKIMSTVANDGEL